MTEITHRQIPVQPYKKPADPAPALNRRNGLQVPKGKKDKLIWIKESYDRFFTQVQDLDELRRLHS